VHLAFITFVSFFQTTMFFFWHNVEVPAVTSGLVTSLHPRECVLGIGGAATLARGREEEAARDRERERERRIAGEREREDGARDVLEQTGGVLTGGVLTDHHGGASMGASGGEATHMRGSVDTRRDAVGEASAAAGTGAGASDHPREVRSGSGGSNKGPGRASAGKGSAATAGSTADRVRAGNSMLGNSLAALRRRTAAASARSTAS
jgi:hypothetical protein